MIFGQLTGRDSLRDLMISIESHEPKYYHLGFGKGTSRSNFANSNEKRDCRIFEDFAYHLIDLARQSSIVDQDFQLNINGNIYAFDSTTIDLCLNIFWWAEFRKTKGGIKLHTLYDVKTSIPGSYYIFDRGYVDYARLFKINQCSAFFVIRAKGNLQFQRLYSNKVNKKNGVLLDQIGILPGFYVSKKYPEKIRRVKFYDEETNNELEFLSNNFDIASEEIAQLYKYR